MNYGALLSPRPPDATASDGRENSKTRRGLLHHRVDDKAEIRENIEASPSASTCSADYAPLCLDGSVPRTASLNCNSGSEARQRGSFESGVDDGSSILSIWIAERGSKSTVGPREGAESRMMDATPKYDSGERDDRFGSTVAAVGNTSLTREDRFATFSSPCNPRPPLVEPSGGRESISTRRPTRGRPCAKVSAPQFQEQYLQPEASLPSAASTSSSHAAHANEKRRPRIGDTVRTHDGRPYLSSSGWMMSGGSTAIVEKVGMDGTLKLRNADGVVSRWMPRSGFVVEGVWGAACPRSPSATPRIRHGSGADSSSDDNTAACLAVLEPIQAQVLEPVQARVVEERGAAEQLDSPRANRGSFFSRTFRKSTKEEGALVDLQVRAAQDVHERKPGGGASPRRSMFGRVLRRAAKAEHGLQENQALQPDRPAPEPLCGTTISSAISEVLKMQLDGAELREVCWKRALSPQSEAAEGLISLADSTKRPAPPAPKAPAAAAHSGFKRIFRRADDKDSNREIAEAVRSHRAAINTWRDYLADEELEVDQLAEAAARLEEARFLNEQLREEQEEAEREQEEQAICPHPTPTGRSSEEDIQGPDASLDERALGAQQSALLPESFVATPAGIVGAGDPQNPSGHDESFSIEDSTFGDEAQIAEAVRISLENSAKAEYASGSDFASEGWATEQGDHKKALCQAVAGLTYASASRRASQQNNPDLPDEAVAPDGHGFQNAAWRSLQHEVGEVPTVRKTKLKKVLLRFDPLGIGLQYTDDDSADGIAVRHLMLPSKDVVVSDEDIQTLVDSLMKSQRDLLSRKKHREVLLAQLRHLYAAVPALSEPRGVATPPTAISWASPLPVSKDVPFDPRDGPDESATRYCMGAGCSLGLELQS